MDATSRQLLQFASQPSTLRPRSKTVTSLPSVCSPQECSADEIGQFCRLIDSEAEVESDGLPARVMTAKHLVFLFNASELIGIAAIKNPKASYRRSVFTKAQSLHTQLDFLHELGWVVV